MERKEAEVVSVLNAKTIIVGVLAVFLVVFYLNMVIWQNIHWNMYHRLHQPTNLFRNMLDSWSLAFLFIILMAIVNRVKPILSVEQITAISLMIMVATAGQSIGGDPAWFTTWVQPLEIIFVTAGGVKYGGPRDIYNNIVNYLPDVVKVSEGYPIAVSELIRVIGFNVLFFGSMSLTVFFMLLLFRRQWVEVERLQFPLSQIMTELIDVSQREKSGKNWRNKFFLVAFLVAFALEAGNWILCLFRPQIFYGQGLWVGDHVMPPLWYWGLLPSSGGDMPANLWAERNWLDTYPAADLRIPLGQGRLYYALGFAMIWLEPFVVGSSLILSLDTLIGFIVAHLGLWVILAGTIFTMYGYGGYYCTWGQQNVNTYLWGLSLRFQNVGFVNIMGFGIGVMATMVVVPIIKNWSQMKPVFTALAKEPSKEFDPERPISYRLTWLGFIGFFLLAIVLAATANIYVPLFITWFALALVIILLTARFIAESGSILGIFSDQQLSMTPLSALLYPLMILMFAGTILGEVTPTNVTTYWYLLAVFTIAWLACFPIIANTAFTALRTAKSKRIILRDMFILSIIAIAIALPLAQYMPVWMRQDGGPWRYILWNELHTYPLAAEKKYIETYGWLGRAGAAQVWFQWTVNVLVNNVRQANPLGTSWIGGHPFWGNIETMANKAWQLDFIIMIAAGVVVGVLIPWLRARWTWIRVGLGGLVLGAFWGYELWSAVYLAFIVKFLVLRYRGVREYDSKVVPLAIGLFAGQLIPWFIFGQTSFLRGYWTSQSGLRRLSWP